MQIFQISELMQTIQEALEAGLEPDPAQVALLCGEGPKAIEDWCDAIANVGAEAEVIGKRIAELKARKEAREQASERMGNALIAVLRQNFPKLDKAGNVTGYGVKTPLVTVWTQVSTSYDVTADPVKHPQFFKVEPELKKKDVIDLFKAGAELPEGVSVTPREKESLRIKR